jgi:hypothetical protein
MRTEQNEIILPPEFSGEAQLILYTRYGDPRIMGWEHKWITPWHVKDHFKWFPVAIIQIHKHFKTLLEQAFTTLEEHKLHREIRNFDGCFEIRNVTGSTDVLSTHSWGAAIDLNATENPVASAGAWSHAFISIMQQHHIFCGQSWDGRKEPMHFSMVNG